MRDVLCLMKWLSILMSHAFTPKWDKKMLVVWQPNPNDRVSSTTIWIITLLFSGLFGHNHNWWMNLLFQVGNVFAWLIDLDYFIKTHHHSWLFFFLLIFILTTIFKVFWIFKTNMCLWVSISPWESTLFKNIQFHSKMKLIVWR